MTKDTDQKSGLATGKPSEKRMLSQKANAQKSADSRRSPLVGKRCEGCGSDFFVRSWRIKGNPSRFCSNDCRYSFMRGPNGAAAGDRPSMTGENHPSWKGGESKKRRADYSSGKDQRRWSRYVLHKDGYVCQNCSDNKKLEAHHIVPWAEDVTGRFDVNNGVTLCSSCHDWVHSKDNPGFWMASIAPSISDWKGATE